MKYKVKNIQWDTDGEDPEEIGLPKDAVIEAESEDEIADALSDYYGWCIFGFEIVA